MRTMRHRDDAFLRRKIVMGELVKAADSGAPVPPMEALAEMCGIKCVATVRGRIMRDLQDEGYIRIESRGRQRRVTILATGAQTAEFTLPKKCLAVAKPKRPVREIISIAAGVFGVRASDIYGPAQSRNIILPRFAACRVAFRQGWPSTVIGRVLARDHSTILHGRDAIARYAQNDPHVAAALHRVEQLARPEAA